MNIRFRPSPGRGGGQPGYRDDDILRVKKLMDEGRIKPATIGDLLDVAAVACAEGWGDQADNVLALALQMVGGDVNAIIEAE